MAPFLAGIIPAIISFFNNGIGHKVGTVVADGSSWFVLLAPVVLWLLAHKEDTALTLTFTYGECLFLGAVGFLILKIIHYTRAGSPRDRNDYRPN